MKIFTIGFTKHSAAGFFGKLRQHRPKKLLDVRLNNVSQLAGFAKREDLRFFLDEICHTPYEHARELAPTEELLSDYKKKKGSWSAYQLAFLDLMASRQIEEKFKPEDLENACLLCSENLPHHCHRRLVAEYLRQAWGIPVEIVHIT